MKKASLEGLVCPQSRAPLVFSADRQELLCKESGLAYPVRNGIPVLLIEEARRMSDEERVKLTVDG